MLAMIQDTDPEEHELLPLMTRVLLQSRQKIVPFPRNIRPLMKRRIDQSPIRFVLI